MCVCIIIFSSLLARACERHVKIFFLLRERNRNREKEKEREKKKDFQQKHNCKLWSLSCGKLHLSFISSPQFSPPFSDTWSSTMGGQPSNFDPRRFLEFPLESFGVIACTQPSRCTAWVMYRDAQLELLVGKGWQGGKTGYFRFSNKSQFQRVYIHTCACITVYFICPSNFIMTLETDVCPGTSSLSLRSALFFIPLGLLLPRDNAYK